VATAEGSAPIKPVLRDANIPQADESKINLLDSLKRLSNLDELEARLELEGLICNGLYHGLLFPTADDIDSLMDHLLFDLHDSATGQGHDGRLGGRKAEEAQKALARMALLFLKVNPNKEFAREWLLNCFKLPHFKSHWAMNIRQAKRPNRKKIEFVLHCLTDFDDWLVRLQDKLQSFDKIRRKWRYHGLSKVAKELEQLRSSEPQLAHALQAILERVQPEKKTDVMAFESYLRRSLPDFDEFSKLMMPFVEARWRALSTTERMDKCDTKRSDQVGWGKVDDHMRNAIHAVICATLASDECISSTTVEMIMSGTR